MANIFFPTEDNLIAGVFVATFGIAPGATYLSQARTLGAAGTAQVLINATGMQTPADLAALVMGKLGATTALDNGALLAYITAQFTTAGVANSGQALVDLVTVFPLLGNIPAYSATYGAVADAFAAQTNTASAYSAVAANNSTDITVLAAVVGTPGVVAGTTFTLTTGADNKAGGAGGDTFDATQTSTGAMTFGSADTITGGDGTDTLTIDVTGTSTYRAASMTGVEAIIGNFSNAADTGTINLLGATGVTSVEASSSTADSIFSNIASTTVALKATAIGNNVLTYGFAAAAVTGTTDAVGLTLNGVTQATSTKLNLVGVETLNITSSGSANTLGDITTGSTSLTKVTVAGDQDMTVVDATAAAVTTIDATGFTGALTIDAAAVAATITGGDGNDSLTFSGGAGTVSITAGAGDDTIVSGNAQLTDTDVIDGGTGTNILKATANEVDTLTTANKLTNIQTVQLTTIQSGALNLKTVGTGVNKLVLDAGNDTNGITFNAGASTLELNHTTFASAIYTADGSATTDALTVSVKADLTNSRTITTTGVETLTVSNSNTAETYGAIAMTASTGGTTTINLSGSKGVSGTKIDADVISASGITVTAGTNGLVMTTLSTNANGQSITGSAGDDTLYGTNTAAETTTINGGAGNDTIRLDGGDSADSAGVVDAGDGIDTIYGGKGADSLAGGAGNDTFIFDGTNTMTNSDTVDGGTGTNTLTVDSAALPSAAAFANVSNIQKLAITGTTAVNLAAPISGLTTIDLSATTDQIVTLASGYTGATTVLVNESGATSHDKVVNSANVALTVQGNEINFDANTTITGGTGTDTLEITADSGDAVLTAMSGINAIVVNANATTASTAASVTLGADIAGGALTVNASALTNSSAAFTFNAAGNLVTNSTVTVTGATTAANDIKATSDGVATSSKFNITTGSGADSIWGGSANDTIVAAAGKDTITGAAGNDNIDGGAGNDLIKLVADDLTTADTIVGGDDTDTLEVTAAGTDLADADFTNVSGVEKITASAGVALELAAVGAEFMGAGFNTIVDSTGVAVVDFAAGFTSAMAITLSSGAGDKFDGSASAATFTLSSAASANITADDILKGGTGTGDIINLTADSNNTGAVFGASASGWETLNVVAAGGNTIKITTAEEMVADGATLTINASTLTDLAADFTLLATEAGTGKYSVTSGAGDDSITTGGGADTINAGEGDNTISAAAGNNNITGGAGVDNVTVTSGNNTITLGAGNNVVSATTGNNTITATAGNNSITVTNGTNTITTGAGNDTIAVGTGANTISAGDGDNNITATGASDKAQTITTGTGADYVSGGSGNDSITAGDGADNLYGNAGKDTIDGGAGNDTLTGGAVADSLTGGAGNDVYRYTVASASESQATDSATVAFDTIDGFDFSVDKLLVAGTMGGSYTAVSMSTAALATLATDLAAHTPLNTALADGDNDAVILTVAAGTAAGTYLVIQQASNSTYTTGNDLVIKLTNATNTDQFSAASFTTVTTNYLATTATAFTGTATDDILSVSTAATLTPLVMTAVALNGGLGTNTLKLQDGSSIASATVSNFTNLTFDATGVSGTNDVTMTAAQHAGFTGTITAAGTGGAGEKITLTTAFTGTGFAAVENYVLANATNNITLGAAAQNVTGVAGNDTVTVAAAGSATGTIDLAGGTNHVVLGAGATLTSVVSTTGTVDITLSGTTASMASLAHAANNIIAAGTETITFTTAASGITLDADVETYVLADSANTVTLGTAAGSLAQNVTGGSSTDVLTLGAGAYTGNWTGISGLSLVAGSTGIAGVNGGVAFTGTPTLLITGGGTVTMTNAQYGSLGTITAAHASADQVTLTTSGTVTANAAIETYVLSGTSSDAITFSLADAAASLQAVNLTASAGSDVVILNNVSVNDTDINSYILISNFEGTTLGQRDAIQFQANGVAATGDYQTLASAGNNLAVTGRFIELFGNTADLTSIATVKTKLTADIGTIANGTYYVILEGTTTPGAGLGLYAATFTDDAADGNNATTEWVVELVGFVAAGAAATISGVNIA